MRTRFPEPPWSRRRAVQPRRDLFGRRAPPVRVREDVRVAGLVGGGLALAVVAGVLLGFLPAARRYLRMKRM